MKFIALYILLAIAIVSGVYYKGRHDMNLKWETRIEKGDQQNDKTRDVIDTDVSKLNQYDRCIELGGLLDNCRKLLRVD